MNRRLAGSLLLACVALALAVCPVAAQDFSKGMIDRKAAIAAAEGVNREKYPNADQVVVDSMERVRYNADGTYVQWAEVYNKLLTEKARRAAGTLSSHFTIPYQRGVEDCNVPLVEIIKPDGKVVTIDVEKNSKLMIDPSGMGANIYNPNDKVIRINVPGLEVGDVLHYVMFDRIVQARIKDTFCDWQNFESTSPIVHARVEIHAPKALPLKTIAVKDRVPALSGAEGAETLTAHKPVEKDGVVTYAWDARDVAQIFPEPDMPAAYTVTQRVLVSTAPDWQTISQWYWKLSEPHFAHTPEMQEKVAELTKGITDDAKKMHAVFNWVSQEVRYMGITAEADAPGYEPHDVKDTFTQKHGVCRDKAALLVVMLRLAGFDAYPVLIHNGPKKDPEVPGPYFNHAITSVRNKDGSYTLMDPTDESTRDLLPSYLNNKSYLVATPKGDPLRTSPIIGADENMMRIATTGRIDAFGDLKCTTQLTFDGINDNIYRGYFSRVKPDVRKRYFEGVIQRAAAGARVTDISITPTDMQDVSKPLAVRIDFEASDVLVRGGGQLMLPVPSLGQRVGMVNFLLGRTGLKKRKYPLETDIACGVHETVDLEIDPSLGKLAAMPTSVPVDTDALSWKILWTQNGNAFHGEGDFRMKAVEFSPTEYLALKDTLRKIEVDLRKMPIYHASAAAAARPEEASENDILVIDSTLDVRIHDATSWTETQSATFRVLTYAGKKQFSEIKLPYNPAWEKIDFQEAEVTGPDGSRQKISAKEINVMDAPSAGTAPRYPVVKVLVASLPGVEKDSTVRYRYVRTCTGRPFVTLRQSFGNFNPIVKKTVRVTAPAWLKVTAREINATAPPAPGQTDGTPLINARRIEGATPGWEWTAENATALKREDLLPPHWSFTPTVCVTTGDWRTWAQSIYPVLMQNALGQGAAARKAAELTAGVTDPAARVRILRDFVAVNIRGVGPDLGEMPLTFITAADRTLTEAYGNTTDRAVLLYAMLGAAGFRPQFVLASGASLARPIRDEQLAHPDYELFGSVLVKVDVAGETVYLNDTDQYDVLGATPHDERPGITLPGGEIITLAAAPGKSDRSETAWAVVIQPNGDAIIRKSVHLFGNAFGATHRQFSEMTPEDRSRFFQEAVAEVSQNAEAIGDLITDFSKYPGEVSFQVRAGDYAVRDGEYLYFKTPESLSGLFYLRGDTRDNPLYLSSPERRSVSVHVLYPAEFEPLRLPRSMRRDILGGTVQIVAKTAPQAEGEAGRALSVTASATLPAAVVPATGYADLFELNRQLSHPGERVILLKTQPAPAAVLK